MWACGVTLVLEEGQRVNGQGGGQGEGALEEAGGL